MLNHSKEVFDTDGSGRLVLRAIDPEFSETEYSIPEGTEVLQKDLFKGFPFLKKLSIPATVSVIPEGTLSNGGGWASDEKGISEIDLDPENSCFSRIQGFFCENKKDGSYKLLRYIGESEEVGLPEAITEIGADAFTDHVISSVYIPEMDRTVFFPKSHRYFLNVLLNDFGKNGKIYDFTTYDRFLLENHFNEERIRMICERLIRPYDLSAEDIEILKNHLLENEENILEALVKIKDTGTIEELEKAGFFSAENIDRVIEYVNHTDREDLLSWLINFKHENIGIIEFDFDI